MCSSTSLDLGDEWSASRPSSFTPGDRAPGTQSVGGWVGHRAGLEAMEGEKISFPSRDSNSGFPVCSLLAIPTELSRLLENKEN
jgi:hypothetical protein